MRVTVPDDRIRELLIQINRDKIKKI